MEEKKLLVAPTIKHAQRLKESLGLDDSWYAIGFGSALTGLPVSNIVVVGSCFKLEDQNRLASFIDCNLRTHLTYGNQNNITII